MVFYSSDSVHNRPTMRLHDYIFLKYESTEQTEVSIRTVYVYSSGTVCNKCCVQHKLKEQLHLYSKICYASVKFICARVKLSCYSSKCYSRWTTCRVQLLFATKKFLKSFTSFLCEASKKNLRAENNIKY